MDDKLALNEHERITQIYTIRNANKKRVKKKHAECGKNTLTYGTKMTQRENEFAATTTKATSLSFTVQMTC